MSSDRPKAQGARFTGKDTSGRRLVLFGVLRAVLVSTLLVVLYYVLPLDRSLDAAAAVGLAVGLLAFAAMVSWQVYAIVRSDRPRLRAFEALAISLPFLLLLFAAAYFLIATDQADSFTEPLNRTDALYFTITVFSTVGFGDIAPTSQAARVVAMVQMLVNLIALGVMVRVVVGAVRIGLERRSGSPEPGSDPLSTPPDVA